MGKQKKVMLDFQDILQGFAILRTWKDEDSDFEGPSGQILQVKAEGLYLSEPKKRKKTTIAR